MAPATTLAATGVRPKMNLVLEGSVRLVEWLARWWLIRGAGWGVLAGYGPETVLFF